VIESERSFDVRDAQVDVANTCLGMNGHVAILTDEPGLKSLI
jgi:hypothetical protein